MGGFKIPEKIPGVIAGDLPCVFTCHEPPDLSGPLLFHIDGFGAGRLCLFVRFIPIRQKSAAVPKAAETSHEPESQCGDIQQSANQCQNFHTLTSSP